MQGTKGKFLIIVHRRPAASDRLGRNLQVRGYALELCCPVAGDALPASVEPYAGVVVYGGTMSANDDHIPGIRAELDWIPRVVCAGKPFLGICLGAQLMARSLGGRVSPHPEGLAEIGYYEIRPTRDGQDLFRRPLGVYHWHMEGFDVPSGGVLLASGDWFPNQAYRYGDRAYGLQFHPEVTPRMSEDWINRASDRLSLPGAQDVDEHRSGHARHGGGLARWLDQFLDAWLTAPCG